MNFPTTRRDTESAGSAQRKRSIRTRRLFHELLEDRRVLAAGLLDTSFGNAGIVTTALPGAPPSGTGIALDVQADGKIVGVGFAYEGGTAFDTVVARYNLDGTLDASFAGTGIVRTAVPASRGGWASDMLIDDQGRILVAGGGEAMVVQRYLTDGSLDLTFSGDGIGIYGGGSGLYTNDAARGLRGLAIQTDGKIVSVGRWFGSNFGDFAVVRLNADGSLDSSFGTNGYISTDFPGVSDDGAMAVAIDDQGRLVVAGQTRSSFDQTGVVRYLQDGTLDTTFGTNGFAVFPIGNDNRWAEDVVIDSHGRIVVGGPTGLARLNDFGQIDSSFGNNGILLNSGGNFALQPDEKIVVGGSIGDSTIVRRFLGDGTVDPSFQPTPANFTNRADRIHDIALQGSKVVTIGIDINFGFSAAPQNIFGLARYLGDNSDPTLVSSDTISVTENVIDVQTVTATDPDAGQTVSYALTGAGADSSLFSILPTGQLSFLVAPDYETPLDANGDNVYEVEVLADDGNGGTDTQLIQVTVLNQASISGSVFVDTNANGLYEANEAGIDGVIVRLLDSTGNAVLDENNLPLEYTTDDGGFFLFEDLDPGEYQLAEIQPTGVTDGAEILGSLGGSIVANDVMQLNLVREDASDYYFAEFGNQVASGDAASIGFWQNKHGQALIESGGIPLAGWLTSNFGNVFGNTFSDGLGGDNGAEVARFYFEELFKQKSKHSAGPAKVDAQFMATALATYFTSSNLAGTGATAYGFNATDTGLGTRVVNVGLSGAAFGVADHTDLTVLQLLQATNFMTDQPEAITGAAKIYDLDGNGDISEEEANLRTRANLVYSLINEWGGI
ncbi:MAG: hypothetical protein KDB03_10455 [Planctomycetales bacterium]|nr:hypothetical protein [Planctomycetales bacterium]